MSIWSKVSAEFCAKQEEFNKSQREAAEERLRNPYRREEPQSDMRQRTAAVLGHGRMMNNAETFMKDIDIVMRGDTATYTKKRGGDRLVHTIKDTLWGETHTLTRNGRQVYSGDQDGAIEVVEQWSGHKFQDWEHINGG